MKITEEKKITKTKNAVLIEGLPGIGNVGKIAVDYLMEKLKAKKIATITSNKFPNLVLINKNNVAELPTITIHHTKFKTKDYYFLAGDFQPGNEDASYELAQTLLDFSKQKGINEIVTMGGIGLEMAPDEPEVYITGNSEKALKKYEKTGVNPKVYGKVGTIIGVTGLLLGLADKKKEVVSLLAETSYEPGIGAIISAKALMEVLNKKFSFKVSTKELDEKFVEEENKQTEEMEKLEKIPKVEETNYIG